MYGDVDSQENSSCASNKSWNIPKYNGQVDQKNILYDHVVNDHKIDNLNKDGLHLHNSLGDNIDNGNNEYNYLEQGGVINQQDRQGNHVRSVNNNQQAQNKNFGGVNDLDQNNIDDKDNNNNNDNDNNNEGQNQDGNNNNHVEISDNKGSYNDPDINDNNSNDNQQNNNDSVGHWDNEPMLRDLKMIMIVIQIMSI